MTTDTPSFVQCQKNVSHRFVLLCFRTLGRITVEDIRTVHPVHVHDRIPIGAGPHTVVHQHRTDPDRERWFAVGGRGLLVDLVVHHHEIVQGGRR